MHETTRVGVIKIKMMDKSSKGERCKGRTYPTGSPEEWAFATLRSVNFRHGSGWHGSARVKTS
jgi:hypothetical protein